MPTASNAPRTKFKTPEGRYNLQAENPSLHPFHFQVNNCEMSRQVAS